MSMTLGAAGGFPPLQTPGGVTLGAAHPLPVVDVFGQMVKVDPVFLLRKAAVVLQRSAVASVMIFGKEPAVGTAGVAFVVAALTSGG